MVPDLKIGERNVTQLLTERLQKQQSGWVILLELSPAARFAVNAEAVRLLTGKFGYEGIYVSLNNHYSKLAKSFDERKIDTKKIYFIDANSGSGKNAPRCVFVRSPSSLTEISIAVNNAIAALKVKKRFLIIDSLSDLAMFNPVQSVEKFMHSIAGKIRNYELTGVIVLYGARDLDPHLMTMMNQLHDEAIRISKL